MTIWQRKQERPRWGGARPGAGRKRKPESERVPTFRTNLPLELQARIRRIAPGMGVATWIRSVVERALEQEERDQ